MNQRFPLERAPRTLGQHLRQLRLSARRPLSLAKMAKECKCSTSFVFDVENDTSKIGLNMAVNFAKAYGTSLEKMAEYL